MVPTRNVRLGEVSGFIPTVDSLLFFANMITASLLYAQANVFRSRALAALASGFVFGGLLLIPHALTFPGAFGPNGVLAGNVNTTGWLANFTRLSLPVSIILYVLLRRRDQNGQTAALRPWARIGESLAAAVILAALATVFATYGNEWLPA